MILKIILIALILFILTYVCLMIITEPSNDRDWSLDQKIIPHAEINDNLITIYNIRNFTYESIDEYTPAYYDKTFDINKIMSVDYVLEPFSQFKGAAHAFLSFGFENDEYLSISVEIRKEKGENFSSLKGLFNQFEIMYVIADEQDVVKLRSNHRKDKVYIYPGKATKEKIQELFLDMIKKTNKLKEEPEFYNSFTNTCTTNIMKHINNIYPDKIPFSYKVLMPGYSDQLAFELDLIDTDLSLKEARKVFIINERAEKHADSEDFSRLIRE